MEKIKILLVIPSLSAGGAQRIMAFLAQSLNIVEFDAQLIVIGSRDKVAYDIENIQCTFLNKERVLFSVPQIINLIGREKPHIVMGSIAHLNVILSLISIFFPKTVFIGRQTIITKPMSNISTNSKNLVLNEIYKFGLRRLNYIICQSNGMARDSIDYLNISEKKIRILRNPITDNFKLKTNYKIDKKDYVNLITVGRLESIKGYDRILEVLSKFEKPFRYTIIGNGSLKENLNKKVETYNLQSRVEFIDYTSEVQLFLRKSDFFLQGSYAEGFPNALLESCAVGTPVIAFDCPGGTSEIIINNVNGYLVNNSKEYLICLNKTKDFDPIHVSESVFKKFSKTQILKKYEDFFKSTAF